MLVLRKRRQSKPNNLRLKWKPGKRHNPRRHLHARDLRSIEGLIQSSPHVGYVGVCQAAGVKKHQMDHLRSIRSADHIRTQHVIDHLVNVRQACGDTSLISRHQLPAIGLSLCPADLADVDLRKSTIADLGAWIAYFRQSYGIQVSTLRQTAQLGRNSLPKIESFTNPKDAWRSNMDMPLWKVLSALNITFDAFSIHTPLDLSRSTLSDEEIILTIRQRFLQTWLPNSMWAALTGVSQNTVCHLANPKYYRSLDNKNLRILALLLRIKLPSPTDQESELFNSYSVNGSHLSWLETNEGVQLSMDNWMDWWLQVLGQTRTSLENRKTTQRTKSHNLTQACELMLEGEVENVIDYLIKHDVSYHDFIPYYIKWIAGTMRFTITEDLIQEYRAKRMSTDWIRATNAQRIEMMTLETNNGQRIYMGLFDLKIRLIERKRDHEVVEVVEVDKPQISLRRLPDSFLSHYLNSNDR